MPSKPTTPDSDRPAPIHPGEILSEEFLVTPNLSVDALSRRIGVPGNRVSAIVAGKRGVSGGAWRSGETGRIGPGDRSEPRARCACRPPPARAPNSG